MASNEYEYVDVAGADVAAVDVAADVVRVVVEAAKELAAVPVMAVVLVEDGRGFVAVTG